MAPHSTVAPALQNSDHVWVDPHILCTPAIADIDSDGVEEMVVAVSYYFDRAYYDSEVSPPFEQLPAGPWKDLLMCGFMLMVAGRRKCDLTGEC